MPRDAAFTQALYADAQGSACTMRCAANERQRLEPLCRHITHPALANKRVQGHAAGQVVRTLKTPWRCNNAFCLKRSGGWLRLAGHSTLSHHSLLTDLTRQPVLLAYAHEKF